MDSDGTGGIRLPPLIDCILSLVNPIRKRFDANFALTNVTAEFYANPKRVDSLVLFERLLARRRLIRVRFGGVWMSSGWPNIGL